MDENIDEMVACQVKSVKIIIKGQGYICHRTAQRTVKTCLQERLPAEAGYLDMGISRDMVPVIKDVGTLKGV